MAGVNNYTHISGAGTTTISNVRGIGSIVVNTAIQTSLTLSDGASTTIAACGVLPIGTNLIYNAALTNSNLVVTITGTGDVTVLTW